MAPSWTTTSCWSRASTVFPNKKVPGGFVYAGSPAKPVRPLAAGEVAERRAKMARDHETESVTVPSGAIAAASQVHPSVFIASTATVKGRLIAAEASSIWYSNNFDAGGCHDLDRGAHEHPGQHGDPLLHAARGQHRPRQHRGPQRHPLRLRHRQRVADRHRQRGGEGHVVQDRVLLAASARTTPGQVLESGWMYGGSPARQMSRLDEGKHTLIDIIIGQYCQYARDFLAAEQDQRNARA